MIRFDEVPDFIVDAFFGSCTYKNILTTTTFGYLNGISMEQLMTLCRWKDTKNREKEKMKQLYDSYEKSHYQQKYYSYNVMMKLVMFLNGDIRSFGERKVQIANKI